MKLINRLTFYSSLWSQFLRDKLSLSPCRVKDFESYIRESPKEVAAGKTTKIWFWVPSRSAGALFILWDIVPKVESLIQRLCLSFSIGLSFEEPREVDFDILFVFKAVPGNQVFNSSKKIILVMCDQADVFWRDLPRFDGIVVTSSKELARLIANRTDKPVYFIHEPEKNSYIDHGYRNCNEEGSLARKFSILWHGGNYSIPAILRYRKHFEYLATVTDFRELVIVSEEGRNLGLEWKGVEFRYISWSPENLITASSNCRFAFLPARASLKNSYLKPAARLRCCYAQGLTAVGDERVPEVVRFSQSIGAPLIPSDASVGNFLESFWNDTLRLTHLAKVGNREVKEHYSEDSATQHWIKLIKYLA